MNKKVLSFAPITLLLAVSFAVAAQQSAEVRRIGFLGLAVPHRLEAFKQGLRDLGWVDGQNITIEHRYSQNDLAENAGFAAELVSLKVEIIVATTTTRHLQLRGKREPYPSWLYPRPIQLGLAL
jgi:putative ABC transport system substrate-binding protein